MKNSATLKFILVTLLSVGSIASASIEKHIPAIHAHGTLKDSHGKTLEVLVASNPGKRELQISIFPSNQDGPREDQTTRFSIFGVNVTDDVLTIKSQRTDMNENAKQTFATLNIYTDFVTASGNYSSDLVIESNNGHGFTKAFEAYLASKFD